MLPAETLVEALSPFSTRNHIEFGKSNHISILVLGLLLCCFAFHRRCNPPTQGSNVKVGSGVEVLDTNILVSLTQKSQVPKSRRGASKLCQNFGLAQPIATTTDHVPYNGY